jgi:TRAP-type mannitol/chloroaromatic compound transport system substrate-binding protein
MVKRIIKLIGFAIIFTLYSSFAYAAEKTFNWKMATTWPPNFPIFQEGVERFAKEVDIMSQSRLKIKVFAGGELIPALQLFDSVSQGTIQI